jgi:crotonobetainyl-CoA:carnitine CoA-transferase CaiB-like acyl-CoA transferase
VAAEGARDLPLTGVTVLDFTRVLAGPYCTRLLADLGAQVIKIERPGEGDEIRYTTLQLEPGRTDQSTYYVRLNAGKRGVAIDLAHPLARDVVFDLVRKSDVVVENFSPGVMKRYGFDEPALRAVKPDLVYCAISGFGQTGPLASMQAYAHLINAISGIMDLDRGGDAQPRVSYLQAADVLAGAHAFGAVCAALVRHARSGRRAFIDVSMFECLVAADDITYGAILNGGTTLRGPRVGMIVHEIGGRHLALQTAGAPHLWTRIVALLGRPELATDPRFATPIARRENWGALQEVVREWLDGFEDVDEALLALTSARVPSVPMLSPEEVIEHPHLQARAAFPSVQHPVHGPVRVTATPFQLDNGPVHPAGPAPHRVGEHTREVLGEVLGYSAEKVEALTRERVIGCG